jgi:predicted Ser/Thr protein kinase
MSCPRCNAPAADETLREFGGVCPKCLLDFSEEQDAPAFPNLEILEMLGQGGMGVVYKAVQKNLGRTVALKVLSPHLSADPEFVERFTREARALASLSHPNIVGIYDSGIHDHVPYLVMEYVDGTPLRKMLASKKLSAPQVLELIPQICDALHYAHASGVVHRDIKPENILVDRQGRVKIADFGLAKLASLDETRITKTGYVMGSPHYMAPEQFVHSGRVDHRADIYSLGVVFYEMLTGEVPMGRFKAPSEKAPVDQRLDPVVLKSLEREPDDRWQSVDEVKARVTKLNGSSSESTLVWNGISILVACNLNPREMYGATETTVYVDGRKLGTGAGFWADRVYGSFQDRDGRDHTLEVRVGVGMGSSSLPCKVKVDGAIIWEGSIAVQNSRYGCAMLSLWLAGFIGIPIAGFVSPWLLLAAIPAFIWANVALVRRGLPKPKGAEASSRLPGDRDGERTKLATLMIGGVAVMSISVIALLTFAGPETSLMGLVLVIFAIGAMFFIWRRTYPGTSQPRPAPPPGRNEERRTNTATAVIAGIAVLAIAVILWLLHTRRSDATGGPVLVIVTGVVLMALAATHFRFTRKKALGAPPEMLRREATALAAGAAAIVLIAVAILLFAVAPTPTPPQAVVAHTKQLVGTVNPPASRWQEGGRRYHHVKQPFRVDELWPVGTDLPVGFEEAKSLEGRELLTKAEFPALMLEDLEYSRGLEFGGGHALIVGLQFKSELFRLRWEKELGWKTSPTWLWPYSLFGEGLGVIFIRHDGSAIGAAAKETLEAAVENNLATLFPEEASKKKGSGRNW